MFHHISKFTAIAALSLAGFVYNTTVEHMPKRHEVIPMTQEKWTASDKPYKDVAARMAAAYRNGMTSQAILERYRANALQHPDDPVAQFAWVVAEEGQVIVATGTTDISSSLVQQLESADPGNVHEFTRYRYCLSQEAGLQLPVDETITIGDHLLRYNPQDEKVRISMIYLLVDTKQGMQFALPRALQWVRQQPNNAKAHSTLALVYEDLWASDRKYHLPDAYESIVEYKAYLRLAPANDPFRKQAEYLITTISSQAGSQE